MKDLELKLKAVTDYLAGGSLAAKSVVYKVHPITLWRWTKQFRAGHFDNALTALVSKRAWNRLPLRIETQLIDLKEASPSVTLDEARTLCQRGGYNISIKGIWNVWRRHGYAGFAKHRFTTSYREYLPGNVISKGLIDKLKVMLKEKKTEEAAEIINKLPIFPHQEILKEIPERLLVLKRQVDRLASDFGVIALTHYRDKARALRQELEKRRMFYSSLRVAVDEGYALIWLGEPKELWRLVRMLKPKADDVRDPGLNFALALFEGHAVGSLLKIKEALRCARKCIRIMKNIPTPHFLMGELAGLYSVLGHYPTAIYWATEALKGNIGDYRKHLDVSLAGYYVSAGEYKPALKILSRLRPHDHDYQSRIILFEAFLSLDRGRPQEAAELATRALLQSKKEQIRRFLHLATLALACSHAASGERTQARNLLRKYDQLLRKYRLEKEYLLRQMMLRDVRPTPGALLVPNLRLAHLFRQAKTTRRAKDYWRTLAYARSHRLFGLFCRLALFFPEPVLSLLQKGKSPGLPKSFLAMPIFQFEVPQYRIGFLGRVRVFKDGKPLAKLRLSPKDASFLIRLSLSKNQRIPCADLYQNYWAGSQNASQNLSHLLVRLKKNLGLAAHLIRIRGHLLEWKFYVSSDYCLFEETIAQAKAMAQLGEWEFAKREYARAFRLCRGDPFKRMYDNWSLDMRQIILRKTEEEAAGFARSCLEHDDAAVARKTLARLSNIIPHLPI